MIEIHSEAVANAASEGHADFDKPMASIENAEFQTRLADSILDAPIVGNHANKDWAIDSASDERAQEERYDYEVENEQEAEAQQANDQADADEIGARLADEYEHEQILNMAEASLNQPQQPAQFTPQQVQTGLGQLDQAVESFGVDQGAAKELAYSLSAPYGADPSTLDANAIGRFMTKCNISAVQVLTQANGDPNQLPPMPDTVQRAVTNDFCRLFGVDARVANVNYPMLAHTIQGAHLNAVNTALTRGLDRPVNELNDGAAAELFVGALAQSFGLPAPPRDQCIKIADAYMGYVVNDLRRMQASQAQTQQTQQRPALQSRSNRSRNASRFQTNRDIFDDETLEVYRQNHGRL